MPRCCYCGDFKKQLTRDHILPRAMGGLALMYGDTINIRMACRKCNSWRSTCHHCPAILMMVLAVARDHGASPKDVLQGWGLMRARFGLRHFRRRLARPPDPPPAT